MADEHADPQTDDLACVEVVEIVTSYLEGALPAGEARRLERHLDTCPGCSEYLGQMRTVAGSLGGLTADSIPAEMRDDLVAAFRGLRDRPDAL
jgi:anti-sigma factor RsiW